MNNPPSATRLPPRRGITVIEMLVAAILLSTVVTLVAPVLLRSRHISRQAQHRQLAVQLASDLLEQITARGYAQATPEAFAGYAVTDELADWLPEHRLGITVDDDAAGRRVTVTLGWTAATRQPARPVRLSTWLQPPAAEAR